MRIRSDWSLERLLEQARDVSPTESVRHAISVTLDFVASAPKTRFRGGRQLVELLQTAHKEANRNGDDPAIERLHDAIAYAEGRMIRIDIEEKYALFSGSRRDESLIRLASQTALIAAEYWTRVAEEYLEEHPDADAGQLLQRVRQIGAEAAFMDARRDRPGRYRIASGRSDMATWLERLFSERIDIEDARTAARRIVTSPDALEILANDADGRILLQAADLQRRRTGLMHLRKVVEDPASAERHIHNAISGQSWIFGGRFIGEAHRRRLVAGDEVDIPLLRADGSLHIVELKKAMIPVVRRHRSAWVPTADVHHAIGQAINYLRNLDEQRDRVRQDYWIEVRRASAIVLIGHPQAQPKVPELEISETLRTHNAHLSRVEVLTYKELLDAAERSLGEPDES
ncbi:Shedu anti-phage system protein SduA domain-containing protein [Microbispora amethystogenes]|nr:Shedu anti-phage system protein SduA domain-containing protein [Microbispora amethystogenes]